MPYVYSKALRPDENKNMYHPVDDQFKEPKTEIILINDQSNTHKLICNKTLIIVILIIALISLLILLFRHDF